MQPFNRMNPPEILMLIKYQQSYQFEIGSKKYNLAECLIQVYWINSNISSLKSTLNIFYFPNRSWIIHFFWSLSNVKGSPQKNLVYSNSTLKTITYCIKKFFCKIDLPWNPVVLFYVYFSILQFEKILKSVKRAKDL